MDGAADWLAGGGGGRHSRPMELLPTFARLLPPETAHRLAIAALERTPPANPPLPDPLLACRLGPLALPSPIGLAAGFDKDGRCWRQMLGLGFGFVEVGTLTPRPQAGNPRPRLFRLAADAAVINRLGFNNGGIAAALPRLAAHPLLGINVGANKNSPDRLADYAAAVSAVAPLAAWITLNISSPNTPGLRSLQGQALPELLAAVREARGKSGPPLFLKVAPDLDEAEVEAITAAAIGAVDALVIANTTVTRPATLRSRHRAEAGGLSGAPLRAPALAVLRGFARHCRGRLPLVGVGGIASGADAFARIRAGASAVQLYTALAYAGPGIARRIAAELSALLGQHGFASVAAAVGTEEPY